MTLSRDHVNYLIWRYLQEAGYGHAAVQLARDWQRDPQQLSFGSAVSTHALLSLVQDGLAYDSIASSANVGKRKYSFTIERPVLVQDAREGVPSPKEETSSVTRHAGGFHSLRYKPISLPNLQTTDEHDHVDDTDTNCDRQPEQYPVISTVSVGHGRGVQSDLATNTAIIDTSASIYLPNADVATLCWVRPSLSDAAEQILVGGARVWCSINIPSEFDGSETWTKGFATKNSHLTILATALDTYHLSCAFAVDRTDHSQIILTDIQDATKIRSVVGKSPGSVFVLRWNKPATMLLSIAIDYTSDPKCLRTILMVFDIASKSVIGHFAPETVVEDAIWISNNIVIVCGPGFLASLSVAGNVAIMCYSSTSFTWSNITYDHVTDYICCAARNDGDIALINVSEYDLGLQSRSIHDGLIDVEWQPIASSTSDTYRILATSSSSGTIKLWNTHVGLHCLQTLKFHEEGPGIALSFSPNGALVACSSGEITFFWELSRIILPQIFSASEKDQIEANYVWRRTHVEGKYQESRMDKDWFEGSCRVLAWSAAGSRIASSLGDKIVFADIPTST